VGADPVTGCWNEPHSLADIEQEFREWQAWQGDDGRYFAKPRDGKGIPVNANSLAALRCCIMLRILHGMRSPASGQ
jgi:hypothetical protein